jgi:hypothetical protein
LAILLAPVAGDRMHNVGEHVRLEAFVLEVPFLQSDPLVQSGKVWHYIDGS